MSSRRIGPHNRRTLSGRRRPTSSTPQWRPPGYGSSLLLDWAVADGADSLDFGLGGAARIHDQSGVGNHGVLISSASLQPYLAPLGVDDKPSLEFSRTIGHKMLVVGSLATALSGLNQPFTLAFYGRTDLLNTNGALLSLSHSTGQAQLQIQWPRASGTPTKRTLARRLGNTGTATERSAQPDITTSHRLLHVTFDGAVLSGRLGDTPATMVALTWGSTAFTSVATTFDLAQFGGGWSGGLRRFSVWNAAMSQADLDEWNEMVTL